MKAAEQQVQGAGAIRDGSLPDMDDEQFQRWAALLEERTGMVLPPQRKSFLVTSLGIRMREIGCTSYEEYFRKLTSDSTGFIEWATLVDRLTVHETRFFRHPRSLELVRDQVLAKAPNPETGNVSIQAWSVGCSTGEEAYTLAMVIDRALRARHDADGYFGVTGTDISQPALTVARQAIYNHRRVKEVNPDLLAEYFEPVEKDRYQVSERLRKRTCFARMNVLDTTREPLPQMDLIYCQNLLIYFERGRRNEIVDGMAEHLAPGGILILGSGELVNWSHKRMQKIDSSHTLAYRRLPGAE